MVNYREQTLESVIEAQIASLKETIERLDKAYDNRSDDFELHSLFGQAIGSMKGMQQVLETKLKK